MWIKPLQIYKPSNKYEVRLVYRVDTAGSTTRHQKSFSIRRHGYEGAWARAREYFDLLKSGCVPEDLPLPTSVSVPAKLTQDSVDYIESLPWDMFALPDRSPPYFIVVVEGAPVDVPHAAAVDIVGCPAYHEKEAQPPPPPPVQPGNAIFRSGKLKVGIGQKNLDSLLDSNRKSEYIKEEVSYQFGNDQLDIAEDFCQTLNNLI